MKKSTLLAAVLLPWIALTPFPIFAAPLTLFVDQRGLDSWSGTRARPDPARKQGPFATLSAAIARAREHRSTQPGSVVTIRLSSGLHELGETLVLDDTDSHTAIIGASGRIRTELSGGRRITEWSRVPGQPDLWETTLPAVATGHWYFHQLFVNGERAQRARTPDTGFLQAAGPLSKGSPIELPFQPGQITPDLAADPDARLVILMKWTDLHLPVRSIDVTRSIATLPGGPRADWMDEPDARFWIENSATALDAPGEWHLDRRTGRLRYFAVKGMDPNRADIRAPFLNSWVQIRGTPTRPVHGVVLQDLDFADADYAMPADGLISPQAAVIIPGTLQARHAVGSRIVSCRFRTAGGYGIELGRGCQSWTVQRCQFNGLGAGGIRIGEPGDRQATGPDANHSHLIADNSLLRLGRIFAPAVGILVFHSATNRILHNHVSDLFYTGISVGWNWGYSDSPCRANEIAYNRVENIGQGRLSDMGGIYTLGPQPGTHIHHNLFRDIRSYRYGGWGLYTDEGSTGMLLEDNVAYRCTDAGFHQHYGRENIVRNNLLAFNQRHQVMRTRNEDHLSFTFTGNVVIHDQGTLLGSNWTGDTNRFLLDSNLYWDTRLGTNSAAYRLGKDTWEAWQARGQDRHSIIADPRLRNPLRPELGLLPGSPAHSIGFRPIDLRRVGPRTQP
jgi:hypothetical protein